MGIGHPGLGVKNFAKQGRLRSIIGTNALQNPLYIDDDPDKGYPTGSVYNGETSTNPVTDYYPSGWSPMTPLNTDGNTTFIGNTYHTNSPPFDDTGKFATAESGGVKLTGVTYKGGRVLQLFGTGACILAGNRDPDRTYPSFPMTGMMKSGVDMDSSVPWLSTDCWTKYEWSQGVSIPDGVTTCTFGAYFRCPPDDLFRELNFGGCYIYQDTASVPPTNVFINAIAIKRASHSLNLRTGNQPLVGSHPQGHYNWSGLADFKDGDKYPGRWNDTCDIQSITYKDAEDFMDFIAVEKTITLQSGTNRRLGFGLYFAENQSYMPLTPPDPNPRTGAIQFYNPFVIFTS